MQTLSLIYTKMSKYISIYKNGGNDSKSCIRCCLQIFSFDKALIMSNVILILCMYIQLRINILILTYCIFPLVSEPQPARSGN